MKRKLLCIFFMFLGAAVIAGTILLSIGRPQSADVTPVIALIGISVATIVTAAMYINTEPHSLEVTGRERNLLQAYRIVSILSIMVCFAFIVIMFFLTDYYAELNKVPLFMLLAATGIAAAALCLKERSPIIERGTTKAAVALLISTVLVVSYLSYLPKYTLDDSINMLRSQKENAQNDIYDLSVYNVFALDSYLSSGKKEFAGFNPLCHLVYQIGCDSYSYDSGGLHIMKGCIDFNPANGAYEYNRMQDQDLVFNPGEWPDFSLHFLKDRDGQHNAVLNLYFRQWDKYPDAENLMLTVSSDEWDEKLKDVLYPNIFPEDEARSFLRNIGEEELKSNLLKKINDLSAVVVFDKLEDGSSGLVVTGTKDKTVEVYFFGINIGTYQNGNLVLKL